MKILIVEDDKKILSFLQKGFREHSFTVDPAADGREAFFLATSQQYDCMILDIMLPNMDGFELVRKVRERGVDTPVIFLTAKDAVEDRVKGLELGGDDYMVKPFAFSELLARVRAITRRGKTEDPTLLTAGDLTLNVTKRIVKRSDRDINLTPTEFNLLQYLMEKKTEVVTRTMLAENVWGYFFDPMTNVIDVHITNLRKKIDLDDLNPLIHTVRGVGYILENRT